jgi:hypothetical protein
MEKRMTRTTLRAAVLALVAVGTLAMTSDAEARGPRRSASAARQATAGTLTPQQAIEKIRNEEVKPFAGKVKALCGAGVKVTVNYDSPANAAQFDYPVKDPGAYLVRAAPHKQLTLNGLNKITEALTEIAVDDLGKKALRASLKEIVVLAVVGGAQLTYKDGVLTAGSHIFGDGEGSSLLATEIQRVLEWGLMVDEPRTGTKVALPYLRAIEKIDADEMRPFKEKVSSVVGAPVKVTPNYASPANAAQFDYPVKDPGRYLVRAAAHKQVTLNLLNNVSEAVNGAAVDEIGKAALKANLKEIVILTVVGGAQLTFKDGVLTVGNHIFGDGEGSSSGAGDIQKVLEWGLMIDEPRLGRKVAAPHRRAIEKIEADQVAPFKEKVKSLVGPAVQVTVSYALPANATGSSQAVKDPGAYLVRTAQHQRLKMRTLDIVMDALTALASGSNKAALQSKLKQIVIAAVHPDGVLSFQNGVLTVGAGEDSSYDATGIRKTVEAGLR